MSMITYASYGASTALSYGLIAPLAALTGVVSMANQRNEMALLSYGIATASALMFNYLPFKEEFIVGTIMLSGLAFKMNKPLVGVQCAFVALDLRFALALQSSLEGRSIIPLNSKGN